MKFPTRSGVAPGPGVDARHGGYLHGVQHHRQAEKDTNMLIRAITVFVALTASLILGPGAATSAELIEPLPVEVAGCFAEHADKHPVRLGEETQESDFVCLAYEELVPCVRIAGHYAWWHPEPRSPTYETLASGIPTLIPVTWQGTLAPDPCQTAEPTPEQPADGPEPTEPTEPAAEPVQETLAAPVNVQVKPITKSHARTVTKKVKVTYLPVARADVYIAKCGTNKVKTTKVKAKLKVRKGVACKVRARGDLATSPWSKVVRVR